MIKIKDRRALHIVFTLIFGYGNNFMRIQDEYYLNHFHTFYNYMVNELLYKNHSKLWATKDVNEMRS